MKKSIVILFLFFTFINVKAQFFGPNLVQNPSFENYTQCPWSSGQLYYSNYWIGFGTEYFNSCSNPNFSVPINWAGFQFARTGNAYAGLCLYWDNLLSGNPPFQESIKNALKDSLQKDKRYCVDYYISLSNETTNYANIQNNNIIYYDSIGTMFSDTVLKDVDYPTSCNNYLNFSKSLIGIDTLNWMRISGSVVANGGEKYLRIGKFYDVIWPPFTKAEFYVYVDDVSVCECSFEHMLGNDTILCNDNTLELTPKTLANSHTMFTWQDSSHASTYIVKQPGTYWVRAYIAEYDITVTDSIHIDYKACDEPKLWIPNAFTPDGDGKNDVFAVKTIENYSSFNIVIFNRWSQQLFESNDVNFRWDGTFKGCLVPSGVYVYYIHTTTNDSNQKKTYNGRVSVMY